MVAIGAVFAVIGYRVFKAGESVPAITDVTIALPKGARVIGTALDEGRIAVTIDIGGAVEVRTYDAKTLKPTGQLRLNTEP
jgi:hypothetical protein